MMKSYLRYEPKETFGIIASPQSNVIYDFSGHLAITGSVRSVSVWNLRQASQVITLTNEHPNYPYQLSGEVCVLTRCFDKNKPCIAVGYSNGQINIFNYLTKSLIASLQGHASAISCLVDLSASSNSTNNISNSTSSNSSISLYYLASGGCDCDIILWDLISLSAVCKLRGHKDAVTDLTFLNINESGSSRKLLVSVSKDTLMKVWCLESQTCIQTIVGHRCEIWSIACVISDSNTNSGDYNESIFTIVTGGSDDMLRGYAVKSSSSNSSQSLIATPTSSNMNNEDEEEEDVLKYIGSIRTACGDDKVVRLCVNSSGTLLAAQSSGKVVEMFNIRDLSEMKRKAKRRLKRLREKTTTISKKSSAGTVASGVNDEELDEEDNNEYDYFGKQNSSNNNMDGDGGKTDNAESSNSITITDILEPFSVLRCTHPVRGFDFCPSTTGSSSGGSKKKHHLQENDTALVSLVRNLLEVYSIPNRLSRQHNSINSAPDNDTHQQQQPQKVSIIDLHGHRSDVRCVCVSGDNRTIATCSSDGLKLWSASTMTCIRSCDSAGYGVSLCFAPGGRYVILGSKEGIVQLIDTASGAVAMSESAHESLPVYALAVRPDGRGFATGAGDKYVKFWDFEMKEGALSASLTRQLLLPHDILAIAYSPTKQVDKLLISIALLDGTVKLLYDDSLRFFLSLYGHKLPVLCLDISDDCTLLVSGSADKTVKIWGLDFGDCHRSLFAHDDSVTAIKFQAQTHYFFSSSKDGRIKYWDADRFECILLLNGHKGSVWNLALTMEGSLLLSAGQDRSIRLWRRTEDLVFVEEEKEREQEARINKSIEAEARAEQLLTLSQSHINGDKGEEGEGNGANNSTIAQRGGIGGGATVMTLATAASIKSGEQLIAALDLIEREELDPPLVPLITTTEAEDQTDKKKKKTMQVAAAVVKANPLLLNKTPLMFMLYSLQQIQSSDLEQALLLLPFNYVGILIHVLLLLLQKGLEVELCGRVSALLLRHHMAQLSSTLHSADLQIHIAALGTVLRHQVEQYRSVTGINLAGLRFIDRCLKRSQEEKQGQLDIYSTTTAAGVVGSGSSIKKSSSSHAAHEHKKLRNGKKAQLKRHKASSSRSTLTMSQVTAGDDNNDDD